MCRKGVHSERIVVGQQRKNLRHPVKDVGLTHAQPDLLVEHRHQGHGVGHPAVYAAERDGAAASHDIDGRIQRVKPVHSCFLHQRFRDRRGQESCRRLGKLGHRRPVRFHPHGVDHRIGAATVGAVADDVAEIAARITEVDRLHTAGSGTSEPFRHQIDRDHARTPMHGDTSCHLADRTQPQHRDRAPVRNVRVFHRLPGGGQHVREVGEAVVRRPIRNLDVSRIGQGHTEILRLRTRHAAVQLRVAEKCCATPLFPNLSRFTLRLEPVVAHEAAAARDLERDDHSVSRSQAGDTGADFFHDPHRFVPENVAGRHEGAEHLVQVQIRPADVGGRDSNDGVGRFLDLCVRDIVDADLSTTLPCHCLHRELLRCGLQVFPGYPAPTGVNRADRGIRRARDPGSTGAHPPRPHHEGDRT